MRRRCLFERSRSGVAAVEFAVVLPLLVLLLAGIWEVGRMIDAHQILVNACREAARQAASGKKTPDEVKQSLLDYLERAGIDTADLPDVPSVVVEVENLTSAARTDPNDAEQLDQYRISADLPLAYFEWSPMHLFTSSTSALHAEVEWYSMNDKELVVSTSIPSR